MPHIQCRIVAAGPPQLHAAIGRRFADADPAAFAVFMKACAAYAAAATADGAHRIRARYLLRALPDAVVQRVCPCGERGCRSYGFGTDVPDRAQLHTLAFPLEGGMESFAVDVLPGGSPAGVELLLDA